MTDFIAFLLLWNEPKNIDFKQLLDYYRSSILLTWTPGESSPIFYRKEGRH